ncbi:methyltransferase domain-containing protein [Mycobacterium sp. PS03-16]|uniref:class I SAM-dependent methyltransferase n=1 Tax=Mycobacterium sp. PS03-16 TaxID=2559611 RepID=UPI0010742641|nr:class I SAM-dependent methyltransferase [Mycobacterium sp. PS03-16]TFV55782.1 methyltransferase domain-containing protein [Mycobacterium sp. PS03-16]
MTTTVRRRGLNGAITRFWSFAAPAYDTAVLQRWVYRPAQDEVLAALRRHGARRIADIGCGTGILATRVQRELSPAEVYGVDMSEGMLAQAQQREPAVWWMHGPAEQLPFPDAALDAVVTTSAFHFFDQPAALREFRRVLAPGGLVAVATIAPAHPAALDRLTAGLANPAHNPSAREMRALFTDAGFSVEDQHPVARPRWTRFVSDLVTVGVRD